MSAHSCCTVRDVGGETMLGLGEPLPNFARVVYAALQTNYGTMPQVWEELYATHAATVIASWVHPRIGTIEGIAQLPNKSIVVDSDGSVFQRCCGVWLVAGGHEPCDTHDMDLPVLVLYNPNALELGHSEGFTPL